MNNIWKYSLVLAFSIILDQLLKGTAQSLIPTEGGEHAIESFFFFVRKTNPYLPFGIHFFEKYENLVCWLSLVGSMVFLLRKIVHYRNRNPYLGWGLTCILMSFFTSWLDRYSQGKTLDYLGLKLGDSLWTFCIGDIFFVIGLIIISHNFIRAKKA